MADPRSTLWPQQRVAHSSATIHPRAVFPTGWRSSAIAAGSNRPDAPFGKVGFLPHPDQPLQTAGWPSRRRFNAATGPSIRC
jgi:hypothetical protein